MKIFWAVLVIGVGLFVLSSLWSYLGNVASQRSDFGIVVGSIVTLLVVGALAQLSLLLYHRLRKGKP